MVASLLLYAAHFCELPERLSLKFESNFDFSLWFTCILEIPLDTKVLTSYTKIFLSPKDVIVSAMSEGNISASLESSFTSKNSLLLEASGQADVIPMPKRFFTDLKRQ